MWYRLKRRDCTNSNIPFLVKTEVIISIYLYFCFVADAGLRSKLNKIMSSFYFTTEPVFRVEQTVAEYESYQVPVEETVLPVNATGQVESSVERYHEKVNATLVYLLDRISKKM